MPSHTQAERRRTRLLQKRDETGLTKKELNEGRIRDWAIAHQIFQNSSTIPVGFPSGKSRVKKGQSMNTFWEPAAIRIDREIDKIFVKFLRKTIRES